MRCDDTSRLNSLWRSLSLPKNTTMIHLVRVYSRQRAAFVAVPVTSFPFRTLTTSPATEQKKASIINKVQPPVNDHLAEDRVNAAISHNFPDFIEHWNRDNFRRVGYGLSALTLASAVGPALWTSLTAHPVSYVPSVIIGMLTAGYWRVGLTDIKQTSHAIRRNYPVIGNIRYMVEMVRKHAA